MSMLFIFVMWYMFLYEVMLERLPTLSRRRNKLCSQTAKSSHRPGGKLDFFLGKVLVSEKYISTESQKYNFHNQTNKNGEVKSLPGGGRLGFFLGKVENSSRFCFLSIDNLDFPRSNWPRVIKMSSPHSTQVVSWYQIVQTSDLWSQVCPLLLTSTPQWPCCQIKGRRTNVTYFDIWQ